MDPSYYNNYEGQSGNGSDNYGWLGLPGGSRSSNGDFGGIGDYGHWWSYSETTDDTLRHFFLSHDNDRGGLWHYNNNSNISNTGDYVRCLKD